MLPWGAIVEAIPFSLVCSRKKRTPRSDLNIAMLLMESCVQESDLGE